MKKLCIITLLFLSIISNAQEEQFVLIKKEATNSTWLTCSNEDKTKWFVIMPHFKKYNGISEKNYLITIKQNIGKCNKRDYLIFTFTDNKYITVRSNELICEGITEINFPLNPFQVKVLGMKSLKSIRYVNGTDKSNLLYNITENDENYFINLLTK
jgi:hypothetical protein